MKLRHSKCNVILNIPVLNNTMYNVDKKLQVKKIVHVSLGGVLKFDFHRYEGFSVVWGIVVE